MKYGFNTLWTAWKSLSKSPPSRHEVHKHDFKISLEWICWVRKSYSVGVHHYLEKQLLPSNKIRLDPQATFKWFPWQNENVHICLLHLSYDVQRVMKKCLNLVDESIWAPQNKNPFLNFFSKSESSSCFRTFKPQSEGFLVFVPVCCWISRDSPPFCSLPRRLCETDAASRFT